MRVLSIGTDRSVLEKGSAAYMRQKTYAEALGALDTVVFAKGSYAAIADGSLTVTPTNSRSRLLYVRDAIRIARTLKQPDVVSTQDPFECGLSGARIAKFFKAPLHVQVHTDLGSPYFTEGSMLNRARIAIAWYVLRRAARVRTVSERVRRALVSKFRVRQEQISVLPIYVDIGRYKHATVPPELSERFKSFSRVVLVVSRLEPEKNVSFALEAFRASAPKDACLVVLGEGSERERFLRETQYEPNIIFEGARDPAPYYKLASIVLVPSLFEGYGRVIVEALAAERPVLSTDVGVAEEAGATVAPPALFAAKLKEWFEGARFPAVLRAYPYMNETEYVRAYAADLAACIQKK